MQEDDKPDLKNETVDEFADGPASGTLWDLIKMFGYIGLTSFGGGLSAWIYLEAVERRRWLKDDEFFAGLALAQILPGPNVLNLAIFIGHRRSGVIGATAALLSLLLPPMVVVIAIAMLIHRIGISTGMQSALQGIAAGAIGTTLCVGYRSLRNAMRRHYWPIFIAMATFVGTGILHISLIYVVLGLLPISFALSWYIDQDA
ncbi:MAG TPA: chromate transporter [Herbaspirillum sp.]|nr:chromate transporter [Herbaspirillum sp.]